MHTAAPSSASHSYQDASPRPAAVIIGGKDDDDADKDGDAQVGLATKTRAKPKKPSQYKVLMLNDDYTPMEFVVMVLKRFFGMNLEEATRVMLHVHQKGVGICGIFPYEVAETKVNQVMDCARQNPAPAAMHAGEGLGRLGRLNHSRHSKHDAPAI